MKRIAIFASGSGSNAENFINYFRQSDIADVSLILSDNKEAKVLKRAEKHGVPSITFTPDDLKNGKVLEKLLKNKIDFIVLAGFLRLVPDNIISSYPDRIVNIHPALLPAYGGKGMYGMNVHKAIIKAAETESGITIHYVNEHYDEGDVVFQATCEIYSDDSPEDLAEKIHELEQQYYPQIVDELIAEL